MQYFPIEYLSARFYAIFPYVNASVEFRYIPLNYTESAAENQGIIFAVGHENRTRPHRLGSMKVKSIILCEIAWSHKIF